MKDFTTIDLWMTNGGLDKLEVGVFDIHDPRDCEQLAMYVDHIYHKTLNGSGSVLLFGCVFTTVTLECLSHDLYNVRTTESQKK